MWEERAYYVYILASGKNGTLYTGVTNDVEYRVRQHKSGAGSRFAKKYGVDKLVYFEEFGEVGDAIHREKCIKKWKRV
ncbi:MAG: GIY-YIG nuclease family protein, partial [Candidatus Peribacteraceae bacterium]|nr:GIY-YIG nuclease family protein [Candidatus Peribacteraceae bacterium]